MIKLASKYVTLKAQIHNPIIATLVYESFKFEIYSTSMSHKSMPPNASHSLNKIMLFSC